jgi:hypothetical protein
MRFFKVYILLYINSAECSYWIVLLLAGFQFVHADQLTLDLPKQQLIGILQYERIGSPDSNMSGAECFDPEQCGFDTNWCLGFQSIILWLAPRIPGIWPWASWIHSAHYRIPNWNLARSKVLPHEIGFYEAKLKLNNSRKLKGWLEICLKTRSYS